MAGIEVTGLTKQYGPLKILNGIDLHVGDSEFVTLIGPSGCGKSTLLKIIAGLEAANAGQIRIGGRLVNDLPPQKRDLAMVFQNYALYPQMTVRQNLSFGLKVKGVKRDEIDRSVLSIAATLGLSTLLDRRPRQLSGGQRQRVAMGRAMVREPQAFLLDEPLSNLDAALRTSMRSEIKTLHQRLGRTMVYVTHDQIEAMTMADRIAIMQSGSIIQYGTPDDLYSRPRNTFVASFFGTPQINLWRGSVVGHEGGRLLVQIASDSVFSVPDTANLATREVMLGIRPETLKVGGAGGLSTVVKLVEPTGSQTQVTLSLGQADGAPVGHVLVSGKFRGEPGTVVHLDRSVDDVHLFDADRGHRVN